MVIVFIGPPGSGKDTQAKLLAQEFGFTLLSPGEVFRDHVDKGGKYAEELREAMSSGKLAPNHLVRELVLERLKELNTDRLVISGALRGIEQTELFESIFTEVGLYIDKVIFLDIDDEEVVERVSQRLYSPESGKTYHPRYNPPKVPGIDDDTGKPLVKREDDNPDAVRERLRIYHSQQGPVLDHYRKLGKLIVVDGRPPITEIYENIKKQLNLTK